MRRRTNNIWTYGDEKPLWRRFKRYMNSEYSKPKISVVMPVYNAAKYLSAAIESILSQTYNNFEFIICYDESDDDSFEIIKKFQLKEDRIIVSSGKNRGLIAALNDGLKLSKGKYIARMDADDISLNNRLEEQVYFMDTNPEIGVCGTWIETFGEVKRKYVNFFPPSDDGLKVRLLFSVPFAHPSVMVRSKLINEHHLYYNKNYETVEDYKFWLDFSNHTKFGVIPKVLVKYRHLDSSLSKTADKDNVTRFLAVKKVFDEVLEKLNIENSESENWLHFTIGASERICRQNIALGDLDRYINKLLKANQKSEVYDQKHLKQFLARKFLIVIFYKIKRRDPTFFRSLYYNIFYQACLSFIKRKRF